MNWIKPLSAVLYCIAHACSGYSICVEWNITRYSINVQSGSSAEPNQTTKQAIWSVLLAMWIPLKNAYFFCPLLQWIQNYIILYYCSRIGFFLKRILSDAKHQASRSASNSNKHAVCVLYVFETCLKKCAKMKHSANHCFSSCSFLKAFGSKWVTLINN